jgi:hypothetical protein
MPQKITVAVKISKSGGTEGNETIFTIPGGKVGRFGTFNVAFPSGTNDELEISFYRGLEKIVPYDGVLVGDSVNYEIEEMEDYGPDEKIICHWKNTGSTTRKAYILLEGELI